MRNVIVLFIKVMLVVAVCRVISMIMLWRLNVQSDLGAVLDPVLLVALSAPLVYMRIAGSHDSIVQQVKSSNEALQESVKVQKRLETALRGFRNHAQAVVDNVGVGVALIGPDMRIMALNKTMGLWFPGLDPSKQPICYMAYGNPSGDGPCLRCPARQTLADGRKHESVGDRLTPSGLRHYRLTSAALNDEDGRPIAAVEIMDDITELKRAEQAVGEHEQFHQAIIDGIPFPVFFKNTTGVYLGCNEAFAAFVGMPRKKIIGGSAYDVSLGELDKYLELDGDLPAERQTHAYECRATRGDGTVRHVVFNRTPLIKPGGAVGGLVGVICDPAKEVASRVGVSI